MKVTRFFKKCEEFSICSEVGDAGTIYIEPADDMLMTLYQIQVKGSGRMAKIFDSNYIIGDAKTSNFGSVREFNGHNLIFESYEPFHIFGFCTLDKNQDWDGRLVRESFKGDNNSWLICFDGEPIINGSVLKPLDYAKLTDKDYNVQLNNAIVGIFTKC